MKPLSETKVEDQMYNFGDKQAEIYTFCCFLFCNLTGF